MAEYEVTIVRKTEYTETVVAATKQEAIDTAINNYEAFRNRHGEDGYNEEISCFYAGEDE